MNRLLRNQALSIVIRLSLGGIFIYSSWSKISDPPGFAHMLWNYKLLPDSFINPMAITLPWLELFAGLALFVGILRRGAALLIAAMLVAFIAGLGADLARGIAIDCGCFSVVAVEKTYAELIAGMKLDLLRDLGMLMMALQVLMTPVNWVKP